MSKNRIGKFLAACAGLIVLGAGVSARADLFHHRRHYHGPSGQPILVGEHAMTDRRCQPSGSPTITVNPAPAHGSISTMHGTHVIRNSVGSVQCNGREVPDTQIFYTSTPGYRGDDSFHITVGFRTVIIEDDITITVE